MNKMTDRHWRWLLTLTALIGALLLNNGWWLLAWWPIWTGAAEIKDAKSL